MTKTFEEWIEPGRGLPETFEQWARLCNARKQQADKETWNTAIEAACLYVEGELRAASSAGYPGTPMLRSVKAGIFDLRKATT